MPECLWPEVPLREIASEIKDGTHGTHPRTQRGVPFLSAKNISTSGRVEWSENNGDDYISESEYLSIIRGFSPQMDDLLITVVGSLGRTALFSGEKVAFQRSVAFIRPNKRIFPGYLLQASNDCRFLRQMERRSNATAQAGLYLGELAKIRIPLPPYDNQRRIAEILSTVDEAIKHTDALIAKTRQIKAGMMHDLFTRGVTPDGQLRPPFEEAPQLYKESPLGWIPNEWQYVLLDKLALRGSGHTPNRNVSSFWHGGIKWVSLADSHRLDKLYISKTEYEISKDGIDNSSAVLHPAGIVLISRDAGVGKSAITTTAMAVSQHFMCWRCGEKLDNYFLYYWLQHYKRLFENIAVGTTIQTIGLPFFKKLKIGGPVEIEEQQLIGSALKTSDIKLFRLHDELGKLKRLKAGLMHDLLSGAVPIKIGDESGAIE